MVWFRNLQYDIYDQFPSHHNLFAVAGMLLVASRSRKTRLSKSYVISPDLQCQTNNCSFVRRASSFLSTLTPVLQAMIMLLGARYTFVVQYSVNAMLLAVYFAM